MKEYVSNIGHEVGKAVWWTGRNALKTTAYTGGAWLFSDFIKFMTDPEMNKSMSVDEALVAVDNFEHIDLLDNLGLFLVVGGVVRFILTVIGDNREKKI